MKEATTTFFARKIVATCGGAPPPHTPLFKALRAVWRQLATVWRQPASLPCLSTPIFLRALRARAGRSSDTAIFLPVGSRNATFFHLQQNFFSLSAPLRKFFSKFFRTFFQFFFELFPRILRFCQKSGRFLKSLRLS